MAGPMSRVLTITPRGRHMTPTGQPRTQTPPTTNQSLSSYCVNDGREFSPRWGYGDRDSPWLTCLLLM